MSDWSSFEKDKAYTDKWRTFLADKNLPKEQEEAINESVKDWFASTISKITGGSSDDEEKQTELPSQEKKERDVAEVLNKFQQEFVKIFNKIKDRLHPDLLDDINNLEMPSKEEVAATKKQPDKKDNNNEEVPSDETSTTDDASSEDQEPDSVAAESINRIDSFLKLLKEELEDELTEEQWQEILVWLRGGGLPSNQNLKFKPKVKEEVKKRIEAQALGVLQEFAIKLKQEAKNRNPPLKTRQELENIFSDFMKEGTDISLSDEEHQKVAHAFDHLTALEMEIIDDGAVWDDKRKNKVNKLGDAIIDQVLKELNPSGNQSTPEETTDEPSGEETATEETPETPEEKQMTSLAHFFDLYYSTRFGSIPSSGNIKLREKIIRQLASLLQRGTADDTILGMFTYLNRIYKQRARNLGRSDTGQDGQQTGEATVIYLNEQPPEGYEKQSSAFKDYLMQEANLSEDEVAPIIEAFKQDLIEANFVVKEAVKAKLSRTIEAISGLEEEKQLKVKQTFKELLTKYELSPESSEGSLFFKMNDEEAVPGDDEGEGEGDEEDNEVEDTAISTRDFNSIIDFDRHLADVISKNNYDRNTTKQNLGLIIDFLKGKKNIPRNDENLKESGKIIYKVTEYLKDKSNEIKGDIVSGLESIDQKNKNTPELVNQVSDFVMSQNEDYHFAFYFLWRMCANTSQKMNSEQSDEEASK
ncbi:MAG: hypothetical protein ACO2ZP_10145, partial [Bacteriovoracaceae bacterium]